MTLPGRNKKGHALRVTFDLDVGGPAGDDRSATPDVEWNVLGLLWRVKGKGRALPLLSALLILGVAACTGPTLRPATSTGTGAIVQEVAGLQISMEAEAWRGRPKTLPKHVLPFLVLLKNTGGTPVTISRTDFLLLDDANRQYLPLAPTEVVTILGGGSSGVSVSPSVGVSGSTAGSTEFGVGLGIFLGDSRPDTRDIIPQALAEGPVQPGAEIKGFLYFPRPASAFKSLRLVVSPRDIPGQPRLDFEFRPTGS